MAQDNGFLLGPFSKHISIRFNDELGQRLARAAKHSERRSVSDFVRNLIEWAMIHYEQHGTLVDLYRNLPAPTAKTRA